MLIEPYFNETNGKINFTRQQSSDFAKKIADDFNPLHNVDSKRFCVPGDLLFSLMLAKYGVSNSMKFSFSGMVTNETLLTLPADTDHLVICGEKGREYLDILRSGDVCNDHSLIDNLTRSYVIFSGHTFPHILIPLMQEQGVMINPERPMVMYQSMLIEMIRFDLNDIELELDHEKTRFEVNGKRGNICLAFNLKSNGIIVGLGEKNMILSGLRPYENSAIEGVIASYEATKKTYFNA